MGVRLFLAASFSSRRRPRKSTTKVREAPKGLPAPRTADGHIDFSGVYYGPGYGPGDPPIRSGDTIARNIARGMKPEDVPLLPSAVELMRQRAATNSKDDPEGLCLPMGTPRRDPYPWKIVQTPKLFLILFEGNVHSYRQVFLDGRPHDPNVVETWWGDSIGTGTATRWWSIRWE